jgi:hypothetical protein
LRLAAEPLDRNLPMKLLELTVLALTLALASCHSVSVSLEPTLPSAAGPQVTVSQYTHANTMQITTNPAVYGQDNETGEAVFATSATLLDQGRNPGISELPEPETQISTSPKVWDLTILAGYRHMSSGAWNELENQGMIGLEAAFYPTALSFLGAEMGIQGSYSRDGERSQAGVHYDLDGSVGEIYGGFRTRGHFGKSRWRHASGIGLGLIRADREDVVNGVPERGNDVSLTFYLHILVAFDISPGVYFGVDFRGDFGSTMTINGNSGSANYYQAALALGFDL